ncbi:MAG TPA: amidase [Thermoanaerobaculia bacterium]|nr:amidase [Thermoanaerobaculia bacterium]
MEPQAAGAVAGGGPEALVGSSWDLRRSAALRRLRHRFAAVEPRIEAFLPEPGRWRRLAAAIAETPGGRRAGAAARLDGTAMGVKDVFHVDGFATRAGSRLPPQALAGGEGRAVQRLRRAGSLLLGKTVTTELAYFEPGPTRNPHDPQRTPGGSSSGSAAAVAAGLCPFALGTQTIGSVCRPAAFCGVVGFKPSYDRIPRDGLVPLAPSLDHVGVLAADVGWAARAAAVLCDGWRGSRPGGHGGPPLHPVEDTAVEAGSAVVGAGLRAGPPAGSAAPRPVLAVPVGPYLDPLEPAGAAGFAAACASLSRAGYPLLRVPVMPDFAEVAARHRLLLAAEAAAVHRRLYDSWRHLLRPRTVELLERGLAAAPAEVEAAREGRLRLRRELEEAMAREGFDLWLSAAAPGPAPRGLAVTGDPICNLPWTQAGLPTVALPAGRSPEGMPLGVQLTARFGGDEALLGWAAAAAAALRRGDAGAA